MAKASAKPETDSEFAPDLMDASNAVLSHMDGIESGPFASASVSAIDPTLIVTIVQAIISLIQNCRNSSAAELKAKASDPGLFVRMAVSRAASESVRRNFGSRLSLGWAEFNALKGEIADGVFAAASEADEAKIEGVRSAALAYKGD